MSVMFAIRITKYHILKNLKVCLFAYVLTSFFNPLFSAKRLYVPKIGLNPNVICDQHEHVHDFSVSCCGHLQWTFEGWSFSSALVRSVSSSLED